MLPSSILTATLFAAAVSPLAPVRAPVDPPLGRADAIVDLATREGAALVQATWRYHDAEVVAIDGRAPGRDLKPSGKRLRTHDVVPHAGAAEFDDHAWEVIDPTTLEQRRGTGRVSFAWYRLAVTIPSRIGDLDPTGATVALEVVLDDYELLVFKSVAESDAWSRYLA